MPGMTSVEQWWIKERVCDPDAVGDEIRPAKA